jgi:hypothetical protein
VQPQALWLQTTNGQICQNLPNFSTVLSTSKAKSWFPISMMMSYALLMYIHLNPTGQLSPTVFQDAIKSVICSQTVMTALQS